ncbi:protein UL42 [Cercopithecine betaherpesvirus 5]|uniref:Protein UL42 n=1 Tax=Simian cytomegalovirus (strain Colburn) TaxID=50292 RepID=G8XTU7_SCMVC|nr:protein UL42 [Cercopithecine betaherpesvirus 5]
MSATNEHPSEDELPPSYEESLGMATIVIPVTELGGRVSRPSPDEQPPPYHLVTGEAPPRPDNFRMDMSDFPATMQPPVEAYYDDGWKWTICVFLVSILGIVLLAILVSVLLTIQSSSRQ